MEPSHSLGISGSPGLARGALSRRASIDELSEHVDAVGLRVIGHLGEEALRVIGGTGGTSSSANASLEITPEPLKEYIAAAKLTIGRVGSGKAREAKGELDFAALQEVVEFACKEHEPLISTDQIDTFHLGFQSGVLKLTLKDKTQLKINVRHLLSEKEDAEGIKEAREALHKLQTESKKLKGYEGRVLDEVDYIDTKGALHKKPELATKHLEVLQQMNLNRFTKESGKFMDEAISQVFPKNPAKASFLNEFESVKRKREKIKACIEALKKPVIAQHKKATNVDVKANLEKQLKDLEKLESYFYLDQSEELANVINMKIAFANCCQKRAGPSGVTEGEMAKLQEAFANVLTSRKTSNVWEKMQTTWNYIARGNAPGFKIEGESNMMAEHLANKASNQLAAESLGLLFHLQKEKPDQAIFESYTQFMHKVKAQATNQDATDMLFKSEYDKDLSLDIDKLFQNLEITNLDSTSLDRLKAGLESAISK